MKRIAIIGGGISGLAAAFRLEQMRGKGLDLEYALYEASPRFGGVLRTEQVEGFTIEAGPDSFLTEKSWAADFCCEAGLASEIITSNPDHRKAYILLHGRLMPIPDGFMFMAPSKVLPVLRSQLFSTSTKIRMAREWFHPPRESAGDESVASFVERHYGAEMVERVAAPLLAGVYGGDVAQLSIQAVLPRFAAMEAQYGSITRGMLSHRGRKAAKKMPPFTSLKNGMQQLADAVLARLAPGSWHANCRVDAIRRTQGDEQGNEWTHESGQWEISIEGNFGGNAKQVFDGLILALPAYRSAALLQGIASGLAGELQGIRYTSSVTVALAYDDEVQSALPGGSGFLVPQSEGKHILATTFVHNKFPHRTPAGRALIRCFLGGAHAPEILEQSDPAILGLVKEDLRQILGITAEPLLSRVFKSKAAMAQYTVGHKRRVERIEQLSRELPAFALVGNAYQGIGIPDCILSANRAMWHVLEGLRFPMPIPEMRR